MKSMRFYCKWERLFIIFLILFSACSKSDDDPVSPKKTTKIDIKKKETKKSTNYKSYIVDDYFNIKDTITKSAPPDSAQKMWDKVKKLIPESGVWRKLIAEFHFAKDGGGSVISTDSTLSKWIITLSPSDQEFDDYHLICHEFGHILSLRNPQLNPGIKADDCTTFSLSEGCATKNSYIHRLFEGFWKDIYAKFPPPSETSANAVAEQNSWEDKVYKEYKDRFLSEYAATNITEDMAVVYADFVISDKPFSSTKSGAERKILLLYEFPELVALRNHARKTIYE